MSLSNYPDWKLIEAGNKTEELLGSCNKFGGDLDINIELDLRNPEQAAWYFGDCAGELVFIPTEPEFDSNGQPIISEMMGYDDKGGVA